MPRVPLGLGAYKRSEARLPEVRLVNRYFERNPTTPDEVMLLTWPGAVVLATVGTGPIRGVLRKAGFLGGDALVVSGGSLYRVTTAGVSTYIGLIGGTARVSMDASATAAKIANGSQLYNYDGTSLTVDAFPDSAGVASVAHIRGYWLAVRSNTQSLYALIPGDVVWTALTFVSAEQAPDKLTAVTVLGDEVLLSGEDSVESWVLSGVTDPPLIPVSGRVHEKGCLSPDSIAKGDNSIFFVSEDNEKGRAVYRADTPPKRISNPGIEARLKAVGPLDIRGFAFMFDGHEFYCLTIGAEGTFAYDASTDQWCRIESPGRTSWRCHLGTSAPGGPLILGDDQDGRLWTLDPSLATENAVAMTRVATGLVPISGAQRARCDRVMLDASAGTYTLRISDDQSATFRDRGGRTISATTRAWWNRLGQMEQPGRVFEVVDSNAAPTRISGLDVI